MLLYSGDCHQDSLLGLGAKIFGSMLLIGHGSVDQDHLPKFGDDVIGLLLCHTRNGELLSNGDLVCTSDG